MTPTEAPVAPVEQEPLTPAAVSEAPVVEDDAAAAAQPTEDPEVKKLRDRLAEQGRKNAASEQLALQQAQAIQGLTQQVTQLSQFATRQQQADLQNRMANMSYEEKIDFLTERAMMPTPPAAPTPPQQADPSVLAKQQAIAAHLDEINASLGLDDNPLTGEEVGFHANETEWLKAAWKQAAAKAKEGTHVPAAKPKADDKPMTRAEQQAEISRQVARITGVSSPNAATPAAASQGGSSIQDMNKIVGDPKLGAQEKARRIAALTPAAG